MSSWSRPPTGVISTSRTTRSVSMPLHISSEIFITEKNEARRAVLHFFRLFFYCKEPEVAGRPDEVAGAPHQEAMAPAIADRRTPRRAPDRQRGQLHPAPCAQIDEPALGQSRMHLRVIAPDNHRLIRGNGTACCTAKGARQDRLHPLPHIALAIVAVDGVCLVE